MPSGIAQSAGRSEQAGDFDANVWKCFELDALADGVASTLSVAVRTRRAKNLDYLLRNVHQRRSSAEDALVHASGREAAQPSQPNPKDNADTSLVKWKYSVATTPVAP